MTDRSNRSPRKKPIFPGFTDSPKITACARAMTSSTWRERRHVLWDVGGGAQDPYDVCAAVGDLPEAGAGLFAGDQDFSCRRWAGAHASGAGDVGRGGRAGWRLARLRDPAAGDAVNDQQRR